MTIDLFTLTSETPPRTDIGVGIGYGASSECLGGEWYIQLWVLDFNLFYCLGSISGTAALSDDTPNC